MNPILKYRGGKRSEWGKIVPNVPSFKGRYIEPFVGGGALYFYLENKNSIISDINERLIAFYRGIQTDYDSIKNELASINKLYEANQAEFESRKKIGYKVVNENENLYYKFRNAFNGEENDFMKVSYPSVYFFINKISYSGMTRYNKQGKFNVPFGHYKHFSISSLQEEHSELLKNGVIMNSSYQELFEMSNKDDFMFLDPPYDCIFNDYGNKQYENKGFTEKNPIELADSFKKVPCKALMTINKTELTEKLYEGYVFDEYDKSYNVNIRNRFKSQGMTMLIKINY